LIICIVLITDAGINQNKRSDLTTFVSMAAVLQETYNILF